MHPGVRYNGLVDELDMLDFGKEFIAQDESGTPPSSVVCGWLEADLRHPQRAPLGGPPDVWCSGRFLRPVN